MEVAAHLKNANIAAQKARLVADQIRGLTAEKAVELLAFSNKKAAHLVKKVLDSAIANAEHNNAADIDDLRVATVMVNEGRMMRRYRPRARGRADVIKKRSCHITIVVSNEESK